MPPRFAFWTILIDGKPTAFRARDPQELLPTCNQLKRTSKDVVMRWFARGRLWESPEAERDAGRRPKPPVEKRSRDWRPGGSHQDPRDRFKKKNRPERAWSPSDTPIRRDRGTLGPPRDKPAGARSFRPAGPAGGGGRKPWRDRPRGKPFAKPDAHGGDRKPFPPRGQSARGEGPDQTDPRRRKRKENDPSGS